MTDTPVDNQLADAEPEPDQVEAGPSSELAVDRYDFAQPTGLLGDCSDKWSAWLSGMIADFNEKWNHDTGSSTTIHPDSSIALSFSTARNRLPKPAVAYLAALGDEPMMTMLVMKRSLVLRLVLELLGEDTTDDLEDRPLTTIEFTICEMLFARLVNSMGDSWPHKEALHCEVTELDLEPHRNRFLDPKKLVLFCKLGVTQGGKEHECHWILPQKQLEELLQNSEKETEHQSSGSKLLMQKRVLDIPVVVSVTLGEASVSVSQLAGLRAGDVVVLDQRINESIPMKVEDRTKFLGWLGRKGNRQAFEISEAV